VDGHHGTGHRHEDDDHTGGDDDEGRGGRHDVAVHDGENARGATYGQYGRRYHADRQQGGACFSESVIGDSLRTRFGRLHIEIVALVQGAAGTVRGRRRHLVLS
jgi:hypothetical protein